MLDFMMIGNRLKNGVNYVYPKFIVKKSSDLMIRGGDFYAVWVEERGLWSTDEQDVYRLIDRDIRNYVEEHGGQALYMWDAESGMVDAWHKYCQKQLRDNFNMLDEELIFSNTDTNKNDYASKRLPYPLEEGSIDGYEKLISTLYSPDDRHKIEWAIGAIVTGDSKKIQKFLVLYGAAGTGKSTILNIIQMLFDGYYSVFDAKALGSSNNSFALEAFKSNPLVAIQHDGDLSRIEDNTRLNSLVSHELMTVNEKFKATYANRFKAFLFMGTNKPVKITDGKSGLIRRLIDVSPSGNKLPPSEYKRAMKQVEFELGAIAYHCREVYLSDPGKYDDYVPVTMMGASNDFYNYIVNSWHVFKKEDGTTLTSAWEMYKTYCDEAKVPYPFSLRNFKEELKNYFREFNDRFSLEDGSRVRSYYKGFRTEIFEDIDDRPVEPLISSWINFDTNLSVFDTECAICSAQYATDDGKPLEPWDDVKTSLSDIDTSRLHYVRVPINHIVIDFDIPDENGNKSLERNLAEANKWPQTYAELSKSGSGVHLHYIYTGDPTQLSRVYSDHIEVKIFAGKSSLRRKLTKCNNLPISKISSGLPIKENDKLISDKTIKSERKLREMIIRNLRKEIHPATKPSVDFIYRLLEDAYDSGMSYDVEDMYNDILAFAANSTNQSDYCMKLVDKMHFKSEEASEDVDESAEVPIVFFDVEVFPNLFIVNWKYRGKHAPVVRLINPNRTDIEKLLSYRLIGFNNRRYDNHMLYGCLMGYTNEQLYNLSHRITQLKDKNAFFREAYNLSYADVYDYCSKKQGLKKWEIELGIHHQELGLPWDKPVPEELWVKVAEYCDNDVIATEAVFDARQDDFTARKILADIAGMTVNTPTNTLSTRFIFGSNKTPQDVFNYRNMGDPNVEAHRFNITEDLELYSKFGDEYTLFDDLGRPIFPGYKYERGVSTYRGEEVGEGGYVYAEPGIYVNVALLDVASMHPSSIIAEELFGPEYTKRFKEIVEARLAIKHKDFEKARGLLGGVLAKYLDDEDAAVGLAQALKIVINSVYGLTAAAFTNPFRDPRNIDNIVAKRGALFMINLKHEVQKRGFTVSHIKTDSIKIPNATPELIQFVMDYGKQYGYSFEHEATYDRMCLVNDAVYIARYADGKHAGEWTATGTQFQVPYVFKKLFSKEEITFDDLCETKSVSTALYLDMNEGLPDVSEYEKEHDKLWKRISDMSLPEDDIICHRVEELSSLIETGHDYQFIGRVGLFCPIKSGCGGGLLMREKDGKYHSAGGAKGYRWLEAEMVKTLGKEADIDLRYYNELVDAAIEAISQYGDFEWFVSNDPDVPPYFLSDDEVPF